VLLAVNLPVVAGDLEAGAIVTIARGRMRILSLPCVITCPGVGHLLWQHARV